MSNDAQELAQNQENTIPLEEEAQPSDAKIPPLLTSSHQQCTLGQHMDILKKRWFLENRGQ